MNKTALATAIALSLGTSAIAHANTAGLTGVWSGTYTFSMFSPGDGGVGTPSSSSWTWDFDAGTVTIANSATFYGSVWTAAGVTFSDTGSSYDGNMTFSWSVNPSIPVFSSWDVDNGASGAPGQVADSASVSVNSAVILATSSAFPGFQPYFSGGLTKLECGSTTGGGLCGEYVPPEPPEPIPVPAAVWLMGSGLLGLVGVGRRRRKA